jgi:hypothetical protein
MDRLAFRHCRCAPERHHSARGGQAQRPEGARALLWNQQLLRAQRAAASIAALDSQLEDGLCQPNE